MSSIHPFLGALPGGWQRKLSQSRFHLDLFTSESHPNQLTSMATLVLTTQSETFEASRASQRSSMVSTTASFQTAPLAPGSTSSRSRSSSVDTVPAPKFNGTALGSSSSTQDVTTEWTTRDVERWDEAAANAPPTGGQYTLQMSHRSRLTR